MWPRTCTHNVPWAWASQPNVSQERFSRERVLTGMLKWKEGALATSSPPVVAFITGVEGLELDASESESGGLPSRVAFTTGVGGSEPCASGNKSGRFPSSCGFFCAGRQPYLSIMEFNGRFFWKSLARVSAIFPFDSTFLFGGSTRLGVLPRIPLTLRSSAAIRNQKSGFGFFLASLWRLRKSFESVRMSHARRLGGDASTWNKFFFSSHWLYHVRNVSIKG